jgi:hypothetical protein
MCGGLWSLWLDNDHLLAIRHLCKTWECGYCGKRRQRQLIARIIGGIPNTFITLTVNPSCFRSPAERARNMVSSWRHLVKFIREDLGQPQFEYAAVIEKTAHGEPHLHVCARSTYIDQGMLSDLWAALTGAYIVDIRRIEQPWRAARYAAKYMSKKPERFPGCKRFMFSKTFAKVKRPPPDKIERPTSECMLSGASTAFLVTMAREQGLRVINSGPDFIWAARDGPALPAGAPGPSNAD